MKSIWDVPFIIVDVETTGTSPKTNRLTDIACITVLGGEIISEYQSLVNPHQPIPEFIERMTGITNKMARNAPEASIVMPKIQKLFAQEDVVFTAHNAQFDLPFVNQTLTLTGMKPITNASLCTLKLARRILNKDLKKNLGSVSDFFNIRIENRHRAYGDAYATAKVLICFLNILEQEYDIHDIEELLHFQQRPANAYRASVTLMKRLEPVISTIPHEPGVYYFFDKYEKLLYIGKAKSLKDRVMSYFRSSTMSSRKIKSLRKKINDIKWECTGTELAALLRESQEIKKYRPPYNTMDKVYKQYPFIKLNTGKKFPDIEISFGLDIDTGEYFGPFRSIGLAGEILRTIEKNFKLRKCNKNINDSKPSQPCLFYQLDKCYSPCSHSINEEGYNVEVQKVKDYLSGYSRGVIQQFEQKMQEASDKLEFEKAQVFKDQIHELRRLFEKKQKVPASVNTNNIIILLPIEKNASIESYIIKQGKLIRQGIHNNLNELESAFNNISQIFFSNGTPPAPYTAQDIHELKIINSWSYGLSETSRIIYIDGKPENTIKKEALDFGEEVFGGNTLF